MSTRGEENMVGVGPWVGTWPTGEQYDAALLEAGDSRNVIDRYRYWSTEAIKADLDARGRHGFHVAIENWEHDLNIGTIVRAANAFNAAAVHIIGKNRFNRRGALGTDKYQHVIMHPDLESLASYVDAEQLHLYGVDNMPGSVRLEETVFAVNSMMLFGSESTGLTQQAVDMCPTLFSIAQFGTTRSLNASTAASIAMHTWITQHADFSKAQ